MDPSVWLRPVTEADLDLIEMLYEDPDEAGVYGFFGYLNPGALRRGLAEGGLISDRNGRLSVVAGDPGTAGELAGEVSWHQVPKGPTSACWNIGIGLLVRARGRGYGTRAQRLLAEYLFAHTQLNRVEAQTETGNLAEQRALEKAGFTREGILRGACFRDGHWRDMVSYSMIRSDLKDG
jgi:RimJ/RimL family protein N-acetyltransferase